MNATSASSSYIVIPARLASTRLQRKLLLAETGKPLIQHTYESARSAQRPRGIRVAADHEDIVRAVREFGGEVYLTSPDCASGSDRVAEAALAMPDADIIVNVQGDEPEIEGSAIDAAVEVLERNPGAVMSTLATPIRERQRLLDPACVKVVFDNRMRALYFSRSPIPAVRDWEDSYLGQEPPLFFQHIGLYAYRRDFLLELARLPQSDKERAEKLEQLRVLDAGHSIVIAVIPTAGVGIDTPEDYRRFVMRCKARARSAA